MGKMARARVWHMDALQGRQGPWANYIFASARFKCTLTLSVNLLIVGVFSGDLIFVEK